MMKYFFVCTKSNLKINDYLISLQDKPLQVDSSQDIVLRARDEQKNISSKLVIGQLISNIVYISVSVLNHNELVQ